MSAMRDVLPKLPGLLEQATGLSVRRVRGAGPSDCSLMLGPHRVCIEFKSHARAGVVSEAVQQVRRTVASAGRGVIPLLIVPYMGAVGRSICQAHGVGFVDFSGNAEIDAPGLRVRISGRPNQYVSRGRPSSVFAPKSSRVARLLLESAREWRRQADLAAGSRLGPGYVSRICKRLADEGLIERDAGGRVRPRDPNVLLDAWQDEYDIKDHDILYGHVPARSGEEVAARFVENAERLKVPYALTGLAAAWLLAPFAAYRLATVFVHESPDERLLQRLNWQEEPRGANLWLIQPRDVGVFRGSAHIRGQTCVGPLQAYLDLRGLPERAAEAAEHLRAERMQWR